MYNLILGNGELSKVDIGTRVTVVKLIDTEANPQYLNQTGTIVDFNTNNMTGNTSNNPLIKVDFETGMESYWKEEIILPQ